MDDRTSDNAPIPCRRCRQPVHPLATKCPHCHGSLSKTSPSERVGKRILGLVGVATALLSLFFGLKEGYFFIEQRQQQRATFAAHMNAAEHFLTLDNLEYAEASLQKALEINPNDQQLRLQYFLLRARGLLRDADYYGAQLPDEYMQTMPDLITSGFSLVENDFAPRDRATLLTSLARLLQHDRRWQQPDAVEQLFVTARELAPDDADAIYWHGEWLINQEPPSPQGITLIQEAVHKQPDNALYRYTLGYYQSKQGDYPAAFASLRRAFELKDKQKELQGVRAANEAAHALRRALLDADKTQDITDTQFYGLEMKERIEITEFALRHGGHDRYLQLLAARLFHKNGRDSDAEPLLRTVLGRYDERSNTEQLELFAAVLEGQKNTDEASQVRQILARKRERETYEEILEVGLDDKHLYKIGLRVAKQNDGQGIEVITVYEGYPFAKAGVQAGDRLLEFAHREVESLRSIWVPISEFSPGTDVPLKIRRGDGVVNLTVVVE